MIRLRLMTAFTIAAALAAPVLAQNAGDHQHGDPPPEDQGGQEAGGGPEPQSHGRGRGGILARATTRTRKISSSSTSAWPRRWRTLTRNKGPVTNDTAKKLLDESLAIDEAEAQLKKATAAKAMAALPAAKAARYIQIENKIERPFATSWPQTFRSSSKGRDASRPIPT